MHNSHIDHLIENGYEFKLGDYINRGWRLFTQDTGPLIGYALVFLLAIVIVSFIPLGNLILAPVLIAGFYLYIRKVANGEMRAFGDFFSAFDHTLQLAIYQFVVGLIVGIGLLFLIIPGIYLGVSYMLAMPLILFEKMDFWTAMETSRKVVSKNWGSFFILAIVQFFIGLAGFLVLGVGVLAAIPLSYCITYAVYEDIIGFGDGTILEKIEEIGLEEEEDLFEGLED